MCTSNGAEERDSAEPAEPNRASLAVTRVVGGSYDGRTIRSLSLSLSTRTDPTPSRGCVRSACDPSPAGRPRPNGSAQMTRPSASSPRARSAAAASRATRRRRPTAWSTTRSNLPLQNQSTLVTVWSPQHFDFGLERDVLAVQPPPLAAPRRLSPSSVARGPRSSFAPHTAKLRTQNLNAGRDRHRECTAPWAVRHAE